MNKKEVAGLLRVSARQIDYLRANAGLPWIALGASIRFERNAVLQWVQTRTRVGGAVPSLKQKSDREEIPKPAE